ncbi:MAG: DNA primase family protein [Candidatus Hodarchaeales archaeon]
MGENTPLDPTAPDFKEVFEERLRQEAKNIDHKKEAEHIAKALVEHFYENNKFIPMRFVNFLLDSLPADYIASPMDARGGDLIYWYSESGIYEKTGIPRLEQLLQETLGDDCTARKQNEVIKQLQVSTYVNRDDFFTATPEIIVLNNGVYNLRTEKFEHHSPLYRALTKLPHDYNPKAKCPKIVKTLVEIAGKDIAALQEWIGYHLYRSYPIHKVALFIGTGSNGKTQVLRLIRKLLGSENCSSVSLYQITSDKYATAEFYGKMANISPDVGATELKYTGTFKALTGEDPVHAREIYGKPFDFYNYAKMNFACNQIPESPDNSDAFFRRFMFFRFKNKFVDEKEFTANPKLENNPNVKRKKPSIMDEITSPEELSGLINWALKGLKRLLKNGEFSNSQSTEEIREYYTTMSNPLLAFVTKHLIQDPEAFETTDRVYNSYVQYCRDNGFVAEKKSQFGSKLSGEITYSKERKRLDGVRVNCYVGIKLVNWGDSVHSGHSGHSLNKQSLAFYQNSTSVSKSHDQYDHRDQPIISHDPDKSYPTANQYRRDKPLIELVKKFLENNGSKSDTADIVMHLRENEYEFEDFKRLKKYQNLFSFENARIRLVGGEQE